MRRTEAAKLRQVSNNEEIFKALLFKSKVNDFLKTIAVYTGILIAGLIFGMLSKNIGEHNMEMYINGAIIGFMVCFAITYRK